MVYLYILKSTYFPKTYVGISDNIQRRLAEHNRGFSKFTARYKPWKLIYKEEYENRSFAMKREKYFKSAVGRRQIKTIIYSAVAQWQSSSLLTRRFQVRVLAAEHNKLKQDYNPVLIYFIRGSEPTAWLTSGLEKRSDIFSAEKIASSAQIKFYDGKTLFEGESWPRSISGRLQNYTKYHESGILPSVLERRWSHGVQY